MKILRLNRDAAIAGAELFALRLAHAQLSAHMPFMMSPDGPIVGRCQEMGIEHAMLTKPVGMKGVRRGLERFAQLHGPPYIVHVHGPAELS